VDPTRLTKEEAEEAAGQRDVGSVLHDSASVRSGPERVKSSSQLARRAAPSLSGSSRA